MEHQILFLLFIVDLLKDGTSNGPIFLYDVFLFLTGKPGHLQQQRREIDRQNE